MLKLTTGADMHQFTSKCAECNPCTTELLAAYWFLRAQSLDSGCAIACNYTSEYQLVEYQMPEYDYCLNVPSFEGRHYLLLKWTDGFTLNYRMCQSITANPPALPDPYALHTYVVQNQCPPGYEPVPENVDGFVCVPLQSSCRTEDIPDITLPIRGGDTYQFQVNRTAGAYTLPVGARIALCRNGQVEFDLGEGEVIGLVYYSEEIRLTCQPPQTGAPVIVPAGYASSTVSQANANALATAYAQSLLSCTSPIFWNAPITMNCPVGQTGPTVNVPAGQFSSNTSQAAANQLAALHAQSLLNCTPPTFWNTPQTASCPPGETGSPYTVLAGQFSSTVSQADANTQALNYATAQLSCTSSTPMATLCLSPLAPYYVSGPSQGAVLDDGITTAIVPASGPITYPISMQFSVPSGGGLFRVGSNGHAFAPGPNIYVNGLLVTVGGDYGGFSNPFTVMPGDVVSFGGATCT